RRRHYDARDPDLPDRFWRVRLRCGRRALYRDLPDPARRVARLLAPPGRRPLMAGLPRTARAPDSPRRRRQWLGEFARHAALILVLAALLFPALVMLQTSFTPFRHILRWPPTWWPEPFTVGNFVEVFTGQYRFGQAFRNSSVIATATALLAVLFGF